MTGFQCSALKAEDSNADSGRRMVEDFGAADTVVILDFETTGLSPRLRVSTVLSIPKTLISVQTQQPLLQSCHR